MFDDILFDDILKAAIRLQVIDTATVIYWYAHELTYAEIIEELKKRGFVEKLQEASFTQEPLSKELTRNPRWVSAEAAKWL